MKRFSFIDFLAVVGIVIVLFAIFVPTTSKAKLRTNHANCVGNLKQLGNAGALYGYDNKDARPGPQPMGTGIPDISWDRLLAIQMGAGLGKDGRYESVLSLTSQHAAFKTMRAFTCSVDTQAEGAQAIPVNPGSFADGIAPGPGICRSYTLNLGTGNLVKGVDDGIAATADLVPIKKVESTAGTVYLIENHGYATVFGQRNLANDATLVCDKQGGVVPNDAFTNPLVPMHGVKTKPRGSAVMHDGHVEVLEQASITASGGQVMQYIK